MRSNTTVRIARRRTLRVADAVLTAAAALTLTACNGSDGGDTKSAGQADTAPAGSGGSSGSSGGAQGSDAKAEGAEAGAAQDQPGGGQADTEGGGRAHAGVERCRAAAVSPVWICPR
ncbi:MULTISPECIES: hypothetical protein [Streptomyces violaceusniger group]|uniref:Lipoprotein n=2 Tax=Streptomyces rhizosphaericus TaxID=114699 RepID=A0ABP4DBH1_9ACTN|nr:MULTISPECIES: hypothetical protein [Streptomyces violaceusniger group]